MPARFTSIALFALILTGSAKADVIRFTDQVSGPSNSVLGLNLPQFDPSLGTLTSARWELSSSIRGQFVFDSELATPFSRQLDIGALIGASVTGGFNSFLDAGQFTLINLGPDDEPGLPPDFAGPDSRSLRLFGGNFEEVFLPQTVFPVYTGDGTVFATASSRTTGIPPGSGISVLTQEPLTVTLGATLTYEFVPVPEPSTFILIGLAALTGLCYGVPKLRGALASVPPL